MAECRAIARGTVLKEDSSYDSISRQHALWQRNLSSAEIRMLAVVRWRGGARVRRTAERRLVVRVLPLELPSHPRVVETYGHRIDRGVNLASKHERRAEDCGRLARVDHHRAADVCPSHPCPVLVGIAMHMWPSDVAEVVIDQRRSERRVHQNSLHKRLVREEAMLEG